MKKFFRIQGMVIAIVWGVLSTTPLYASTWKLAPEGSKVGFILKSSLHDVHGDALSMAGELVDGKGNVVFSVAGLKTYNNKRDRNMYNMFENLKYSQIVYEATGFVMDNDKGLAYLEGALVMHGLRREFPLTVQAKERDGILELSGEANISLKTFELKPPSVLGLIKVADMVKVTFIVRMKEIK